MQSTGSDPETDHVLSEWGRILDTLGDDPLKLSREVDWVTKYQLIEDYRSSRGLELSDPKIAMLDLQYHDVNTSRGLYYVMQRKNMVDRVTDDHEIQTAMSMPPQTTRAKLRGDFIRQAKAKRRDFTVDWVPPEAERPGPADRALQGSVPGDGRTRREADQLDVSRSNP